MSVSDIVVYFNKNYLMLAGWWWPGGSLSSTHRLTVADGLAVPELFNHQLVHGREVSANDLLAVLTKVISNTEVLLEVESVLSNPERIHHVGSNHVKSLNTLLASVSDNKEKIFCFKEIVMLTVWDPS